MVDPAGPDCAYVIPLVADMDRVTPEGRVRVHETRNAGRTWTARGDGLPAEHAYLTAHMAQPRNTAAAGVLNRRRIAPDRGVRTAPRAESYWGTGPSGKSGLRAPSWRSLSRLEDGIG
jgi:hypothetical protein